MGGSITGNYSVSQTFTRHVEEADQKFARKNEGESLAKAPNQNIETGTRGAFKGSLSFFKESMEGFFDAPFGKKLDFLKDRIELRSIQKSEVKTLQRLDREDAATTSERNYSMPKYDKATAPSLLLANPKAPSDFRPVISTFMGSLLQDAEAMMKDAKKNGKPITREEAFANIANKLIMGSSAAEFIGLDFVTLRGFASDLAKEHRTEKSNLLNFIVDRFETARKPEEAVKLFKGISLDHSKNAGEQSFLRGAKGNDAITQKFIIYGGKSEEILSPSKEIWTDMTSSDNYKTLEIEIRKISNDLNENLTLASTLPKLSKEGREALAHLSRNFIEKLADNGVPETLQGVLKELQSKIIEGKTDINPKVSQLFVSAFLKNVTPSITDNPMLYKGVGTREPSSEDTKPQTKEETERQVAIDKKVASALASLISASVTGAINSGIDNAKITSPIIAKFQTDVLLPLGHEVTSIFTKAGMSEHGETERTRLSDKRAEFVKNNPKLQLVEPEIK